VACLPKESQWLPVDVGWLPPWILRPTPPRIRPNGREATGVTVPIFEQLKKRWANDRLGVIGVGSGLVAFALWALPFSCSSRRCYFGDFYGSFQLVDGSGDLVPESLWIGVFLVISFLTLLLRAGNAANRPK
jgi:hypothetical protein